MSFLDRIKAKKDDLNPTETRVTSPSGCVTIETKNEVIRQGVQGSGFVVDTKPDLQVAPILQYLYMGSQDPACDREILNTYNILHILSLGIEVPTFDDIIYYNLPILDLPEFDLKPFLQKAFSIIDSARKSKQCIYVHCNAGISRSSTVIIAYLMNVNVWSYNRAYDYLKQIRPCIKPNEGFVKQLIDVQEFKLY